MNFNLICTCGARLMTVTNCNPKAWLQHLNSFGFRCDCGRVWGLGKTSEHPIVNNCPQCPASALGITLVAK